jgi:hypothetical protein
MSKKMEDDELLRLTLESERTCIQVVSWWGAHVKLD